MIHLKYWPDLEHDFKPRQSWWDRFRGFWKHGLTFFYGLVLLVTAVWGLDQCLYGGGQ
jgi:hypothetical protein